MRIHTDHLLTGDFYDAARKAGVTVYSNSRHNSRSRSHAFDFTIRGSSKRWPMGGDDGSGLRAATWDEWGVFLSALFGVDPLATVPHVYENEGDFDRKTYGRFALNGEKPADMHGDHRWEFYAPFVQKCKHCDAKVTHA